MAAAQQGDPEGDLTGAASGTASPAGSVAHASTSGHGPAPSEAEGPGVWLALDLGDVRIGVARSDADGRLAVPVTTVASGEGDVAAIAALVHEWQAVRVLVGLPLRMDGTRGPAAEKVSRWVEAFHAEHPGIPVELVDERLSTVQAGRSLRQSGRDSRRSRAVIDQAAAVVILESALARRRNSPEDGSS